MKIKHSDYHIQTRSRIFLIFIIIIVTIFALLFSYINYTKVLFHLQMRVIDLKNIDANKTINTLKGNNNYNIVNTTKTNKIINKNKDQPFPIDLVYTWVDSSDEKWLKSYEKQRKKSKLHINQKNFASRYESFEEFRYSLRTVEKFLLPMINKIYIVTANQIPKWINTDLPIIQFVSHSDIFPNYCSYKKASENPDSKRQGMCLPTFNSNAIDFSLINIPNLSEHFIYCNDDMYFGNHVNWTDFFDEFGRPKFISKDKDWGHIRSEWHSYKLMTFDSEQGGKQFTAMVANTITTFMDKFGLKNPVEAEFSHIPFPMTKTLFREVIEAFKDKIDQTIQSRFRLATNLQMETLMIQYGLYKQKAVKIKRSSRNCRFFVADTEIGFYNLVAYAKKKPKMFCINADSDFYAKKIQGFLDNLVSEASIFEKENLKEPVSIEDKQFWFLNETIKKYEFLKHLNSKPAQKGREKGRRKY